MNEKKEYNFLLCPDDYCCNHQTNKCNSPTTCSFNRTGPLCGQCQKDYFVNLNNKCVHNSKCSSKSRILFWVIFFSIPIAIAFLLTHANDIKEFAINMKQHIKCTKGKRNAIVDVKPVDEKPDSITVERRSLTTKELSLSAVFNIVMTFYQLKALVTVKSTNENINNNNAIIESLFNIELISKGRTELEQLCAFHGVTVIMRNSLKGFGTPIIMFLSVLIFHIASKLYRIYSKNESQSSSGRYYAGYYIVLAFCYKDICRTAFAFVNCKIMNGRRFLYIDGSLECFQPWQIAILVFLALWVFPFPIAVGVVFKKLQTKSITPLEFLVYLMFPVLSLLRMIWKMKSGSETESIPKDTDDRLAEIADQPYKEKYIWWEAWRFMERFIIAAFSVFLTNPIYRILYITTIFAFFWYLHSKVSPYKRSMFLLKRLDAVSWVCLFILSLLNEMRAVVYIYNIPNVDSIYYALKAADVIEQIFSPLWYFIIAFILMKVCQKFSLPF